MDAALFNALVLVLVLAALFAAVLLTRARRGASRGDAGVAAGPAADSRPLSGESNGHVGPGHGPRIRSELRLATATEPADAARPAALLQLARHLAESPEMDRLHATLSRTLPSVLGFRDVWVVTRFGGKQRVILPDGSSLDSTRDKSFDSTSLARPRPGLLSDAQQWMTFPLVADNVPVGLLGVGIGQHRMTDERRTMIAEAASLLAFALRTSDAFERMREVSTVDSLTGCSTRAEGLHRLDIELRRAQRSGKPVSLLLLDLDHFKAVNDRYGHPCGDAVLAEVGRIMMQTLRASDIRCRWGGEEFLIALPETSLEPAKTVGESLRRRIAEARIVYGAEEVRVTGSVGATVARPGETDTRVLLIRVDRALYRAKHEGRNCLRAVLGDLRGEPIGSPSKPGNFLAFPDRRDPSRPDRRRLPGPGRRRTDLSALGR